MKDKLLYAFGVIIGLVACIPLLFVRVIEIILAIMWLVLMCIDLGLHKLDNLLVMALTNKEPEGSRLDETIDLLKSLKELLHK